MKKLLAWLLCAALLLASTAALAETPEGYPEVVEGIDFGGAEVMILDYWSGDGARAENPTEEQAAQYAYRDWINATYNVNVHQLQGGDWGTCAEEMINFTGTPDGSLRMYIIEPGKVGSLVANGIAAPVSDKYVDLNAEKWNAAEKDFMTVGGKLYVDSKLGEGSTFTIKIPLSLSIIDVMGIDVAGYNFSIPKNIIVELFRATPDMLMENDTLIMRRGMCLPLYRMSRIFGVPGENKPLTDGVILLCDADGRKACFFADRLIADQQVVVKPFSVLLSQYKLKEQGLSGCSVLGDGSITTILDMKEIIGNLEESEGR